MYIMYIYNIWYYRPMSFFSQSIWQCHNMHIMPPCGPLEGQWSLSAPCIKTLLNCSLPESKYITNSWEWMWLMITGCHSMEFFSKKIWYICISGQCEMIFCFIEYEIYSSLSQTYVSLFEEKCSILFDMSDCPIRIVQLWWNN